MLGIAKKAGKPALVLFLIFGFCNFFFQTNQTHRHAKSEIRVGSFNAFAKNSGCSDLCFRFGMTRNVVGMNQLLFVGDFFFAERIAINSLSFSTVNIFKIQGAIDENAIFRRIKHCRMDDLREIKNFSRGDHYLSGRIMLAPRSAVNACFETVFELRRGVSKILDANQTFDLLFDLNILNYRRNADMSSRLIGADFSCRVEGLFRKISRSASLNNGGDNQEQAHCPDNSRPSSPISNPFLYFQVFCGAFLAIIGFWFLNLAYSNDWGRFYFVGALLLLIFSGISTIGIIVFFNGAGAMIATG